MKLSRKIIASSLMCLALAIPVFANIYNSNASQMERLEAEGTKVTWTAENQAHTGSTITNPMVFGDEECPVSGSFDRGTNPDRKPAWNGSPSSHIRMYPDNTMTITLQEGFVFESIMITSEIFGSYDDAHFEYTTDDGFEWNTAVGDGWEAGDCTSREIVFQMRSKHTSAQIRVSSITVTYSSPALPIMLRDILPVDFPKDKENGWTNGNSKLYADSTSLYLDDASILPLDVILMPNDGNFAYIDAPNNHFYSFYMNDDSLVKINLLGFPSSQNGDYALKQATIGDILPNDFPTYVDSLPSYLWTNENDICLLRAGDGLAFITKNLGKQMEFTHNIWAANVTKSGSNYTYSVATFVMTDNVLTSIEVQGMTEGYEEFNGTYQHRHAAMNTHAKVEPTCTEPGQQAYYECACSKFFSDEALTKEIANLQTWLAKDGEGYIAPLGHDFTKEVKYEWNADHSKCTATAKCSHTGCNETLTETANGIYVKDFDATCSANEKGHYEATFQNAAFTKRETLMMDKENTATGHDFVITYTWNEDNTACTAHAECSKGDCSLTNEGTITVEDGYAVATFVDEEFETQRIKLPEPKPTPKQNSVNVGAIIGISVGSVVVLGIIAYVVMFFVWKKSEKGLKFLISSFKWINNKIFKK